MSGNNALLDSNIIIYLSKREVPLSFLDQFDKHYISVITYMEDLVSLKYLNKHIRKKVVQEQLSRSYSDFTKQ